MKSGYLSKIVNSNLLLGSGFILLTTATLLDLLLPRDVRAVHSLPSNEILISLSIGGITIGELLSKPFVQNIFQFLFILLAGALVQYMASENRIIRVRSNFPFFLSCLLIASILPLIPFDGAFLSNIFLLLSCVRLLSIQESSHVRRVIFDATLLLIVASIFQPRLLFLLPVFWFVMVLMQTMTFRNFLASLVGLFTTFWLLIGVLALLGKFSFILMYLNETVDFQLFDIQLLSIPETIYLGFMAILVVSALISFWPRQHLDKLKTRNSINSVLAIWFGLLVIWLFSSNDLGILLHLMTLSSVLIAHFFSLVDTWYSRVLFVLLLVLTVVVFLLY